MSSAVTRRPSTSDPLPTPNLEVCRARDQTLGPFPSLAFSKEQKSKRAKEQKLLSIIETYNTTICKNHLPGCPLPLGPAPVSHAPTTGAQHCLAPPPTPTLPPPSSLSLTRARTAPSRPSRTRRKNLRPCSPARSAATSPTPSAPRSRSRAHPPCLANRSLVADVNQLRRHPARGPVAAPVDTGLGSPCPTLLFSHFNPTMRWSRHTPSHFS